MRLLHDHGVAVRIGHEARELQIAIGLVAAEEGLAIVPESVHTFQVEGVVYRDLAELATSPIIMSHRAGDHSPEIALMAAVIGRTYGAWGYAVPEAVRKLAG